MNISLKSSSTTSLDVQDQFPVVLKLSESEIGGYECFTNIEFKKLPTGCQLTVYLPLSIIRCPLIIYNKDGVSFKFLLKRL